MAPADPALLAALDRLMRGWQDERDQWAMTARLHQGETAAAWRQRVSDLTLRITQLDDLRSALSKSDAKGVA